MARFRDLAWICVATAATLPPPGASAQGVEPTEDGSVAPRDLVELKVQSGDDLDRAVRAAISGVTSVEVVGEVPTEGNLAYLSMTLELFARGPGPHRVPIGLDGLYPREAVADGRPLAWEAAPPEGWFVVLPGEGSEEQSRTVRVDVVAPVRPVDERRELTLSIPLAPRTSLRLDLPGAIDEATLADGSPLAFVPIDDGRRSRIEARLDPRSALSIRWLPRREEGTPLPPLMTGGGHIALDLTDGALTAQSTWEIQVRRGEAASVALVPDPGDEILDVEVEGRSIAPEPVDGGLRRLIRFPRTLRKGDAIRASITTRRPIPPPPPGEDLSRVSFSGHRFEGLIDQRGTLSISRDDGLRILADAGPGLRRIDPRDLRDEIARVRPTIISAFKFADQPFGLGLRVGPMPAIVRVAQRSIAVLEPGGAWARVESWLDYRSVRGQVFALRVEVPEGLEVDRVGPTGAIAAWDVVRPADTGRDQGEGLPPGPASLVLTLASALREGLATPLRIEVSGRARLDPGRPGDLPLFRPTDAAFDGGRLAVSAPPDLEVAPAEVPDDDDGEGEGAAAVESPPATDPGPWSSAVGDPARMALWLRHDAPVDVVPMALTPRTPGASATIDQLVRVARDGIDVQQDLTLYARDGALDRIDLAVPPELERGWELVDRGIVEQVEPIAPGPDGVPIRRLTLAQPASGSPLKLRISYRVPGVDRLSPGEAVALEIPRIEVVEPSQSAPPRVEVAAGPGIELRTEGDGWRRPAENQWVTNPDGGPPLPIRQVWVRPPSAEAAARPRIAAKASTPAALPEALASRLWLRTEQAPDGSERTSAWFRFDDHGPTLGFQLPAGSELDRVYLDGEPVPADDLDALDRPGAFLLHLPAEAARDVLIGLSYRVPREASSARWQPPTLLEGGRVLETLWEVRVPWSRALIGVPGGFTDENVWYWGGYVWKRRPGLSAAAMASWVAGPGATADSLAPTPTDGRIGDHGYLFGRPGDPGPLGPTVVSRAMLVLFCSGAVLLLGLLALVRYPPVHRAMPFAALAALVALILMGQGTSIVMLQSSAVGWMLVAVAVLTRRAVDRRPAGRLGEQSGRGTSLSSGEGPSGGAARGGGSVAAPPLVGSDDSTAIRPRPETSPPPPTPPPFGGLPTPEPDRPVGRDDVLDIPSPRADREAS